MPKLFFRKKKKKAKVCYDIYVPELLCHKFCMFILNLIVSVRVRNIASTMILVVA